MTSADPRCQIVLQDALLLTIPGASIPSCVVPEGLALIETNPRRISLVSRRGMRPLLQKFQEIDLTSFTPPTPIFGEPRLVTRAAQGNEMAVMVSRVENYEAIAAFVNDLFSSVGLKNPERHFVYHLTLANNAGGNPRGSIAYLNKSDFEGPAASLDSSFQPHVVGGIPAPAPSPRRPGM